MVRSCLPQPSHEDVTMIVGSDPSADPDDAASDCDGPLASNLVASEGLAFMAAYHLLAAQNCGIRLTMFEDLFDIF